jgi:5'-phosphate synthase pdxT subunit
VQQPPLHKQMASSSNSIPKDKILFATTIRNVKMNLQVEAAITALCSETLPQSENNETIAERPSKSRPSPTPTQATFPLLKGQAKDFKPKVNTLTSPCVASRWAFLPTKAAKCQIAGFVAPPDLVDYGLLGCNGSFATQKKNKEMVTSSACIGVLALQGAFEEHETKLKQLGCSTKQIRKVDQLSLVDGIVLPGGESTAMALLDERRDMFSAIRDLIAQGMPVMGTCAGLVLLADRVQGQKLGGQAVIGGLNVEVSRNYFGSQVRSFETDLKANLGNDDDDKPHPAVFIRAPAVISVGEGVKTLASVSTDQDDNEVVVAVQQNHILATAFHPELTNDDTWHQLFLDMVRQHKEESQHR